MSGTKKASGSGLPRIVIIPQVYPPEVHPTAVMTEETAVYLVEHGWEVTVCAGLPNHPKGALYPGWKNFRRYRTQTKGLEVIRLPHFVHPSRKIAVRAAGYISSALSQCLAALFSEKADIVLVIGPPLVGPILAAGVAARFHASLATVIFDLYPDIAIETYAVAHPWSVCSARRAEKLQYDLSDLLIVPSFGFKQTLIKKGVLERKVAVVPVWLDAERIRPGTKDTNLRRRMGIAPDTFVAMVAGTVGRVSGASVIVEAARLLKNEKDILFLFVGEVEKAVLSNVRFLPFQPEEQLSDVLSSADVCLVTLAPGRGRTSVPSKVQAYMAAGRPIIASADEDSDTAEVVRNHDLGIVTPPGDARLLCEGIQRLKNAPERCERLGINARTEFLATYEKRLVLGKLERALRAALRNDAPSMEDRLPKGEVKIVPLTRDHAAKVALVHKDSFRGFFLSSFGEKFLSRYYESIVDFGQIGFIATVENGLIGFVTGIESASGFYKRLVLTKTAPLFAASLSAVAANPKVVIEIAQRLKERIGISTRRTSVSNCVELTSIAVSEQARGSRVAHLLVEAFKDESLKRGLTRIVLETDLSDNERATRFYHKEGFVLNGTFRTAKGRVMAEFVCDLSIR